MRDDTFLFGASNICFIYHSFFVPFFRAGVLLIWRRRSRYSFTARWSSSVARRAHNPKVAGSNPVLATLSF